MFHSPYYICIYFSGGYDLADAGAASDMTDCLLSMLMEYLTSNQNLELNKTFKIYL